MTATPTILLDARWLPKSGAGTVTRSLLAGLAELRPPEQWLLWGPAPVAGLAWPGAVHLPTAVDPASLLGQRSALRVPAADVVVHPHQTRPVHRLPAASCVLDLIQLRHRSGPVRAVMTLRLRAAIGAARALFTIAPSVRDEMAAVFGVDPAAVTVLHLPVDAGAAERVRCRRAHRQPQRVMLAIGRFAPHKNHRRLVAAFAQSRFAATGGQLHLVGGTADRLDLGGAPVPPGVHVLGHLGAGALEEVLAGALVVVQPSLEEGYGLPVAEALMAGVPVTSSPIPAVCEFGPSGVPLFDPTSVAAISEAIDETVELVESGRYWERVDRSSWAVQQPSPAALARQVLGGLAAAGLRPDA